MMVQIGTTVHGLSSVETEQRLAANGPNMLQEGPRTSALAIILAQFKSLIIWILLGAAALSGLLGEIVDMIAIIAIVLFNSVMGFYQEYKAEESIAARKKMTAPQAKVRRDGRVIIVAAADVVVGDILELEAGDLVAACARLLQAAAFKCVESALTGESEAVSKQAHSVMPQDAPLGSRETMLFIGTSVATGTGVAAVVATAMNTKLGRIASLIKEAGSDRGTPLQQKLDAFGRLLVWVVLGIVALLFGLGWWSGNTLLELLMKAVSLSVAAVPEGLPAVVTVSLALGVTRMSRRRTLERKLPAVETLGSTTEICTDKTGTLTVGEMTVRELCVAGERFDVTGEGY
jgi:Ca2+-transporting ATPase